MSHTNHQIHNIVYDRQNKFDNYVVHDKRKKLKLRQAKAKNDYGAASLLSDPLIGFKRASPNSYPCPPLVILSHPERHVNGCAK
jgi:hypothetical protein